MKKIIALMLALVLALGLFAGCGSEQKENELVDFDVILDWYPNAFHAFLYTAQEKGYFEEAGLKVNIIAPAGYSDGLTFPAAGRAKIGLYYMNDVVTAYADEGMGIEIIGAATQQSLNVVCALKESGIASPADFKGKTIGYSGSPSLKAKIISMIASVGLKEEDVTLIDVGFDIVTALTTGTVDVVAGGMINSEVIEMQDKGYELNYWTWSEYGVPQEYNTVFVANKADFGSNPEIYNKFIEACKKGFADVKADPDAAMAIIMSHEDATNYALDEKLERQSLDVLLGIEADSGVEFTSMSKDVWNNDIKWMHENGLVNNLVDCTEFVNVG